MTDIDPTTPSGPPAGWYDAKDGSSRQQWFDGIAWTDHFRSKPVGTVPQQPTQATVAAPVLTDPRKARDKAQYVRQQRGHSIIKHVLLGTFILWINVIYISASPNHYWHA